MSRQLVGDHERATYDEPTDVGSIKVGQNHDDHKLGQDQHIKLSDDLSLLDRIDGDRGLSIAGARRVARGHRAFRIIKAGHCWKGDAQKVGLRS